MTKRATIRRYVSAALIAACGPTLAYLHGCTAITISPTCPSTLRVGESAAVVANEQNPGAIATYVWEVFPATAGTFVNRTAKDTRFQARAEGTVTLRLTASDGLYQAVAECTVVISGVANLAVSLEADPIRTLVDDPVTLTCESIGTATAEQLQIVQTDGDIVAFSQISEGVVRFSPDEPGELEFRCIGRAAGAQSAPVFVTVIVEGSATDNDNQANGNDNNANANLNQNANENDNAGANQNANASDNDNETDNGNTNTNANANGNANQNANDNRGKK